MASKNTNTFVFLEKCYPDIKKNLDRNRGREFLEFIPKYIDRNSESLMNAKFNYLYWNIEKEEGQVVFDTIGKRPDDISRLIKESGQTDSSWKLWNKPAYWSIVNIIKYFKDTKKEKEMNMSILYFGIVLYSSVINARVKYPFNPNKLEYIINNVMSNRYDIKKYGTILKVLQKLSLGCHETYKDYLTDKEFTDYHILQYIMNMYVRINNFIKEILTIYNKYKDSKVYMNSEREGTSEEDFYETTNISAKIYQMSEKCANTIITSNLNQGIVEMSANIAGVSVSEVRNVVKQIVEKDDKKIKEFIVLFLHQYLIVDKHLEATFSSKNFLVYINKIYGKSNTNDKGVIRIKEILDGWLRANSEKYLKTSRIASIIAWRKSIYLFFCIATQQVILNKY